MQKWNQLVVLVCINADHYEAVILC